MWSRGMLQESTNHRIQTTPLRRSVLGRRCGNGVAHRAPAGQRGSGVLRRQQRAPVRRAGARRWQTLRRGCGRRPSHSAWPPGEDGAEVGQVGFRFGKTAVLWFCSGAPILKVCMSNAADLQYSVLQSWTFFPVVMGIPASGTTLIRVGRDLLAHILRSSVGASRWRHLQLGHRLKLWILATTRAEKMVDSMHGICVQTLHPGL